ncbi:INTEGRAL MEMBRANE PROTEIN (Rhomboid family) [Streptomyces venezuelae]|nr:INTEGRAL MEMBRANE PROTEIN (Rhomboid family) [Streptomyces venezuelae]
MLAVLAMAFVMFAGFWTDWLWYRSVEYSSVFTTTLWTKIGLFAVFGLLMGLAVGLNIWLAYRLRPPLSAMSLEQQSLDRYRMGVAPFKKWVLLAVTVLVGLIAGASASGQWRTWLMWVNGVKFGQKDPQFGLDVAFYAFDLPWYRFLLAFGFAAAVLSLIAAALTHYLYGGLRITSPGARATAAATGHLSVLLGIFVSLKAVAYWLDRYGLAVKSSDFKATGNWTGLRYVDANAYLPAKTILFCIAAICAVLFFATLWRRTWQLPVIGFGLMVLSAVLIGGLYPAIVQKFQVQPNEQAKEAPYIQKNIDATRKAYAIDSTKPENYSGKSTVKAKDQLRTDADSAASYRVLDPNIVSPTFQQLEQKRKYYQFPTTLDVDRYQGKDTVIGLRELNIKGIPKRNWINDHFTYTHGYGAIMAKGTQTDANGSPVFTESGLPTTGDVGEYQQRIYYGEKTDQYSIVGGPQKELDYEENGEKTTSYKEKSGVSLSGAFNRAAYAVAFSEPQILYSGAIGEGSRILYNRTPKERVEAVAPWLTIDGDAYPAVVNGRIQWIVDAYTTTNGYPYASRTTLGDTTADSLTVGNQQRAVVAQQNQVNYIRNSVKATVDAYDGTVNLYQWDTQDPVLKTWMKAFPDTVKAKSEIDGDLMEHLRYPQDMFKVQRELLTRYHVTDPAQFYSGSDAWQVPDDPTNKDGNAVPPYYLSMKMPGDTAQRFSLTTTFTPNGRPNLGGFMAVDADATSKEYGRLRLLRVTEDVPGPAQVQSKLNGLPDVAQFVRDMKGADSDIQYGNLLTVPLDGGFLYVEPVYAQGRNALYPLLKKVAVSYVDADQPDGDTTKDTTVFEDNLTDALNAVFGVEAPTKPTTPPKDGTTPPAPTTNDAALKAAIADAQKAYDAGEAALQKGDWTAYGKAQEDLQDALQRAADAGAKLKSTGSGG